MENIFKWIDSFDLTTVNHYISWEREYPYNEVKCKAQYDDPFKHFTPEIAKIIKKAHSLNSDLHWIRMIGIGIELTKAFLRNVRFLLLSSSGHTVF